METNNISIKNKNNHLGIIRKYFKSFKTDAMINENLQHLVLFLLAKRLTINVK